MGTGTVPMRVKVLDSATKGTYKHYFPQKPPATNGGTQKPAPDRR